MARGCYTPWRILLFIYDKTLMIWVGITRKEVLMKARFVGNCLFCTPVWNAIKVGEEIVIHPNCPQGQNGKLNWVHRFHCEKKEAPKSPVQQKLF